MNIIFKNRFRGILIVSIVSIMLILTACGLENESSSQTQNKNDDEEVFNIRYAHILAEDTPLHEAAMEMKKEVEEKSDGRLNIEIYPNGQLYDSERETVEAIQLNNIEMSEIAAPVVANFVPEFSVFNLPFLFKSREDAHEALDGELGDKLSELLLNEGLVGLGYGENGFRNMLNNKRPIEKPSDLKGLKLRVIENKMYEDIFKKLGANPSPMGFGETYTALQQGVFDGLDIEITVAATSKLDEVLDYLSITEHTYTATTTLINKDFYDNLPDDLQEILNNATNNYSDLERSLTEEQEEEKLNDLKENMQVNELDKKQKDEFQEQLKSIYTDYEDKIDKDLIELAKTYSE